MFRWQRSPVFELVRDLNVINTWFKFEGKIQNNSKVITFKRNHTDADDANDAKDDTDQDPEPKIICLHPPDTGGWRHN